MPYRAGESGAVRIVPVHPSRGPIATEVEPIRRAVADRAGAVDRAAPGAERTTGKTNRVFAGKGVRLARHHVDHTPDGARAVENRGRSTQDLDALDRPG